MGEKVSREKAATPNSTVRGEAALWWEAEGELRAGRGLTCPEGGRGKKRLLTVKQGVKNKVNQ